MHTHAPTPLDRRRLLTAGAALLAAPPRTHAAPAIPTVALAEQAAIWGIPLIRTGRYFALARARGLSTNRFYLNQTLATPTSVFAAPNVDTIYGFAWLDLSHGPVVVTVPDGGDRYYSIHFIDAYETILGYAGKSATSPGPGLYVVTPPNWHGRLPAGAHRFASPTTLVLALTRTLVKGAADLPAAQRLQASYTIAPLSSFPAGAQPAVVQADALNAIPTLTRAGAFDSIDDRRVTIFAAADTILRRAQAQSEEKASGQVALFADAASLNSLPLPRPSRSSLASSGWRMLSALLPPRGSARGGEARGGVCCGAG
jgi:hypothetical protein